MILPNNVHVDYDMSMSIRIRDSWTTFAAFLSFVPDAYRDAILKDIKDELYKAGDYTQQELDTLMLLLEKLAHA